MNHSKHDHLPVWGEFVWSQRLGYVQVHDIIRAGTLIYVLLTGVVTVLTSDLITLVFLAIVAVLVLKFAKIARYIPPERRVTVYYDDGLFIAEHIQSGRTRHGETPQEALTNLRSVV